MEQLTNKLATMSVRTDNTRRKISELADHLNTMCQVLGYKRPVKSDLNCNSQLVPVIIIGQLKFVAQNWLISKDEKTIVLYKFIIGKLSDSDFVSENSESLSSCPIVASNVFTDESTQPLILSEKIFL